MSLNVQVEHMNDLITVTTDRAIRRVERMVFDVLNPRIECEVCHRCWDIFSPCALCAASRWAMRRVS